MMGNIKTLRDVREVLFGLRLDTVAQASKLSSTRLAQIEDGDDPTVYELEQLASVYGIDSDRLAESPVSFKQGDGIQLLASLDEFRELGDMVRLRVMHAAAAARDLVTLQKMESPTDRVAAFRKERPRLKRDLRSDSDFREGDALATQFRTALKLGRHPIPSVTSLLAERFPSLNVLYANLGPDGPAGICFTDDARGPTIVMNVRGKNENILVRRFHLVHELCHLLVDWDGSRSLIELSGFLNESKLSRERRANAFAVRFILPQTILKTIDIENAAAEAASKLAAYGLHYAALRLYLRNEASSSLPVHPPSEFVVPVAGWADAEGLPEREPFPLAEVPLERRTLVAETAARLYSANKIRRDEFAEFLRVTPAANLERVLDFYAFNLPEDVAEAAA